MIAPELHTADLEPDGFAWLSELAARLLHRPVDEVQVLHRGGEVISAVRSGAGLLPGPHRPVADPAAAAVALRADLGAARVTLVDADQLDDLARAIDRAAPTVGQIGLMVEAARLWHEHPAVVVDPPTNPPRWPSVATALHRMPAGSWGVLAAWRGDDLAASLLARWCDAGIDLLTSAERLGMRPRRAAARELVARVERDLGPVPLALLADADDLEAMADAEDPWTALADSIADGGILEHRGVEEVLAAC